MSKSAKKASGKLPSLSELIIMIDRDLKLFKKALGRMRQRKNNKEVLNLKKKLAACDRLWGKKSSLGQFVTKVDRDVKKLNKATRKKL